MTLEQLQSAKVAAMKNKDLVAKEALSSMIDACQKAAITPKGRIDMTENLVNETLIKYQKTMQEMIDTCPASRSDLLTKYQAEMEVVKQYAPQLITDPAIIKAMIVENLNQQAIEFVAKNKGLIMKTISPQFKGKADMKVVNQVVSENLK